MQTTVRVTRNLARVLQTLLEREATARQICNRTNLDDASAYRAARALTMCNVLTHRINPFGPSYPVIFAIREDRRAEMAAVVEQALAAYDAAEQRTGVGRRSPHLPTLAVQPAGGPGA